MELQELYTLAENEGINIVHSNFSTDTILGMYLQLEDCEPVISLNYKAIKSEIQEKCVLAEECGHYFTGQGIQIEHTKYKSNMYHERQENRAIAWATEMLIPPKQLYEAFRAGIYTVCDLAEYVNVTQEFFESALSHYSRKYPELFNIAI